ncbi:DNA/RNA helicase, superfamily II [Beggiatoa alba B18LD]|uniref:ATP-dependent RNA helicase DeaD n=1 Tax=Beggiatoa alba B18LD TaxID=395493 RepID=I3CDJ6_9GAMM|nr:DEAD/DEAH box helicase [Beggiatoa alba]EIJ41689.1 DNA/RNA helicase, superfamily II [Beggiatoa alba B18LD]
MPTEIISQFSQLALAPAILKAIDDIGYETPSPIQAESIPPLLAGRDLLGQAQTGTGKTAAFALPLLSRLDLELTTPQILVLTPTRELAIQVAEAMQKYARHLPNFHVLPIYGGQDMGLQLRQLKRGVHVVVGTPGRVLDHLGRGTLRLDQIATLVLDEADEMLRMGFIDDVEEILNHTPSERQVALFSATMPDAIRQVARRHLKDPVEIRIQAKTVTVASITQRYWQVSGVHKLDALTRILEVEDFDAIIIFVRTKTATAELAEKLEARGYASAPLNGDMNQSLREKTVERLKNGALDIVIATDVAARGLNVERITHVINYDIPTDTEAYVHRIGRTGRAGRKGEAILFVSPREQRMLRDIERATRQPITPMQLPSHEDITDKRISQFKQAITDALAAEELGFFEDIINSYQQEHDIGLNEIASALAFLFQRERPLLLPKVEEKHSREKETIADDSSRRTRAPRNSRQKEERDPREARESREPREPRERKPRQESSNEDMVRYRIEVGRTHGAQPKHIVGAIANEAGLESHHIGQIKLYDTYSTVDLPEGMPKDVFQHLQKVWVCGQQLRLVLDTGTPAPVPASKGKSGGERASSSKPRTAKTSTTTEKTRVKSSGSSGHETLRIKRTKKAD